MHCGECRRRYGALEASTFVHRTPVLSTTHSPHLAFRVRLHSEDSGLPQHGFQTAFGVMGERTTIDRDIEAVIRDKLSKHPTTSRLV